MKMVVFSLVIAGIFWIGANELMKTQDVEVFHPFSKANEVLEHVLETR